MFTGIWISFSKKIGRHVFRHIISEIFNNEIMIVNNDKTNERNEIIIIRSIQEIVMFY